MKKFEASFILGSKSIEEFPKTNLPEIAFTGRSNVGKSSLLNSIVLRKNLAQTSSTPGKTRQINFFNIENQWIFADLPGFGYAKVSKKQRQEWQRLIFDYFVNRKNLRLICVLIDSRHEPMDTDLGIIEWLENNSKKFVVVLTKIDKISQQILNERVKQINHLLSLCKNCIEVLPYSSIKNIGRENLIAIIKRETNI